MTAVRDPRTDPRAGDEVAAFTLDNSARHRVVKIDGENLTYEIRGGSLVESDCTLAEWRKWAANTEIAFVAEETTS